MDTRCIDCGTCRELVPDLFGETGIQSVVQSQPRDPEGEHRAWLAAAACPTASIGRSPRTPRPDDLFPLVVDGPVSDLGHTSEDSFGATSYLVERPDGNLMVDSPVFTRRLTGEIDARGGLAHVLLTHRDDVADARAVGRALRRPGVDPPRRPPGRAVRHRRASTGTTSRPVAPGDHGRSRSPATPAARSSTSSTTAGCSRATRSPGATAARTSSPSGAPAGTRGPSSPPRSAGWPSSPPSSGSSPATARGSTSIPPTPPAASGPSSRGMPAAA